RCCWPDADLGVRGLASAGNKEQTRNTGETTRGKTGTGRTEVPSRTRRSSRPSTRLKASPASASCPREPAAERRRSAAHASRVDGRWRAVWAEPLAVLRYAVRGGRVSALKARLFAVACCRRVGPLLTGPARHAVEVAERFADGLATEEESRRAEEPLQGFIEGYVWPGNNTWADEARPYYGVLAAMYAVTFYEDYAHGLLHGAADSSRQAAFAVGPIDAASADGRCAPEWARQGDLVRCI